MELIESFGIIKCRQFVTDNCVVSNRKRGCGNEWRYNNPLVRSQKRFKFIAVKKLLCNSLLAWWLLRAVGLHVESRGLLAGLPAMASGRPAAQRVHG